MAKKTRSYPVLSDSLERKLNAFSRLDEDIQLVGYSLAWLMEPISMTALANRMARAGMTTEAGKRFPNYKVKESLQRLKKGGVVEQRQGSGWEIENVLSHYLVAECFERGIDNIRDLPSSDYGGQFPLREDYFHFGYGEEIYPRAVRQLRAAYFGGNAGKVADIRKRISVVKPDLIPWEFVLFPFDPERLAALPPELLSEALCYSLDFGIQYLHPSIDVIVQMAAEHATTEDDLRAICEATLILGDEETFGVTMEILGGLDSPTGQIAFLEMKASEEFFAGKDEEAIEKFEESMAAYRKATRKKRACPRGLSGVCFLLALLRRGRVSDFPTIRQVAKWGKQLHGKGERYLEMVSDLVSPLAGEDVRSIRSQILHYHKSWTANAFPSLDDLFFFLQARLIVPEELPGDECAAALDRLKCRAKGIGFLWLAAEAAALRDSWNPAPTKGDIEETSRLWSDFGSEIKPLCESLRAPEPWESAILAIETLGHERAASGKRGRPAKKKQASQKQLIWCLNAESYYWRLTPIERTVYASGKTSKGRKVALRRLKERPADINYLTDQDRAAAARIKRFSSWGSTDYGIEDPRILLELAGHPLLFADAEASKPIELVRQAPTLSLSEMSSGKIKLQLSPKAEYLKSQPELIVDSPSRYLVIDVKETHVRLREAFGGKMSAQFPAGSRDRIAGAVANLAGDVSIESDEIALGNDETEMVAGDLTPILRLVPHGEGLHGVLFVRPIPQVEITQEPGNGKALIFATREGKPIGAKRDLKAETDAVQRVLDACPTLSRFRDAGGRSGWDLVLEHPLECLELLTELHPIPAEELRVEWPEGQRFRLRSVADTSAFQVSLGGSKDWLTASGELAVDDDLVLSMRQLLDLTEAARDTPGFVQLEDDQFLALTREFRRQLEDIRAFGQPSSGDSYRIHPLAALAIEDLAEGANAQIGAAWKKQTEKLREELGAEMVLPPSTLQAELRPYQLEGYQWLSRLSRCGVGACLADDMGLGKTVQALAVLLERAPSGPALVVAPTSVVGNWLDEIRRFAPTLNPILFGQPGEDRQSQLEGAGPFDLIISSWGLLQSESESFAKIRWHSAVLDEVQAIKNRATKRSKAAMKLDAEFRLIITGTPVENRLSELHNLFHFINPGLLGTWERFRRTFADPIENENDADARDRLRRLIRPFILRRLKSSVLRDLPPRTEITLQVEASPEEAAFYEALRQKAVDDLEREQDESAEPGRSAILILSQLTRLRRACCHPRLIDPKTPLSSSKLRVFAETLEEILANRHKVLVFSQFVDHLSLVREHLDAEKISYQYLDGSTPAKKRQKAVKDFQSGLGDVFLVSLKAGGTGLNLTAADYVIHMDPWWNPATEDQASDRAHRIGQTRPVTIYRLIMKGAIEEKIVDLHHRKRNLADSILEGADSAGRLTPEELLELLRN